MSPLAVARVVCHLMSADLLCRLGDLAGGLRLLVGGEVESDVVVDDRLPRQERTGRSPQLGEPVGCCCCEHQQVAVEARAAVALGEYLGGEIDGRRVVVVG